LDINFKLMEAMSLKDLFSLENLRQKIKLDNSIGDFIIFREEENPGDDKINIEKYSNEWNHEYELIYSSYVLEE